MVSIHRCIALDPYEVIQWNSLMTQLYLRDITLNIQDLHLILNHPTTHLYIARYHDIIVGSAMLAWYPITDGPRAWIEDVIVDQGHRGKQIGKALLSHIIEESRKIGLTQLNLTSRPERIEANAMYQKLGFLPRDTNTYRLRIDPV